MHPQCTRWQNEAHMFPESITINNKCTQQHLNPFTIGIIMPESPLPASWIFPSSLKTHHHWASIFLIFIMTTVVDNHSHFSRIKPSGGMK
jgi:hypothetical protein